HFPAALTGVHWSSSPSGALGSAGSGTGDINETVTLTAGGSLTYTVVGTIDPSATGTLSNTATVAAPPEAPDVNPSDNSATDVDTPPSPAATPPPGGNPGSGGGTAGAGGSAPAPRESTAVAFDPATGLWLLRGSNSPGPAALSFAYGDPSWLPVVG